MRGDYAHPEAMATVEWLYEHLDDPSIRIVDARYGVRIGADGNLAAVTGRDAYREGHIPGAVFVDVMADLSDHEVPTRVVGLADFEDLVARLGIADDTTVVAYDDAGGTWAARLWWALRYYGHDAVKLLDGGLTRWLAQGLPVEGGVVEPVAAPGAFHGRIRSELRVEAADVRCAIGESGTCIVDALPEAFFNGQARLYPTHRAGHIPTARNVPAPANLEAVSQTILPPHELSRVWDHVGLELDTRVITYCGGGVFGSFDLFVLYVMGHENAALYDASWMEWGADPRLPIES